jgi:hypothetical protein
VPARAGALLHLSQGIVSLCTGSALRGSSGDVERTATAAASIATAADAVPLPLAVKMRSPCRRPGRRRSTDSCAHSSGSAVMEGVEGGGRGPQRRASEARRSDAHGRGRHRWRRSHGEHDNGERVLAIATAVAKIFCDIDLVKVVARAGRVEEGLDRVTVVRAAIDVCAVRQRPERETASESCLDVGQRQRCVKGHGSKEQ